eukprot:TRINITY_DN44942_c0_g1_i1.p2 TRINITY_DN44942_c0_g1~~TRINITY_DN44942_c0_g1_i1.p2  ORF type:complete len:283 (+),score=67.35 TRINITY_DN44942_c0_g1_i1:107-955(+)
MKRSAGASPPPARRRLAAASDAGSAASFSQPADPAPDAPAPADEEGPGPAAAAAAAGGGEGDRAESGWDTSRGPVPRVDLIEATADLCAEIDTEYLCSTRGLWNVVLERASGGAATITHCGHFVRVLPSGKLWASTMRVTGKPLSEQGLRRAAREFAAQCAAALRLRGERGGAAAPRVLFRKWQVVNVTAQWRGRGGTTILLRVAERLRELERTQAVSQGSWQVQEAERAVHCRVPDPFGITCTIRPSGTVWLTGAHSVGHINVTCAFLQEQVLSHAAPAVQ